MQADSLLLISKLYPIAYQDMTSKVLTKTDFDEIFIAIFFIVSALEYDDPRQQTLLLLDGLEQHRWDFRIISHLGFSAGSSSTFTHVFLSKK